MSYVFGSIWNQKELKALNDLAKNLELQGKSIQDLVAKGQLTPKQYADLITLVNNMANENDVFLKENGININDLDEPTRKTFLEAQGIDVNYVLGEGNVKVENTSFVEEIMIGTTDENITNKFTMNGSIGTATGSFIEDSGYRATDFILIGDADYFFRYVLDGESDGKFTDYQVAYYDENREFLSGENASTNYTVTQHGEKYGRKYNIPSGAKYIRFSLPAGNAQGGSGNLYTYIKVIGNSKRRFVNDYNSYLLENMDVGGGSSHLSDKTIACFGDSIFGNFRDGTGITDTMIEQTGATVHNFGFGGTTMAIRDGTNPQDVYWDEFCMTRIADYIATGDFTPLDAAIAGMNKPLAYFAGVIAELKTINWNDIDIITIEHGTNDFTQGIPAKDVQNLKSRETYYGAYIYAIERILTAYPHIKVVLLTPSWRHWRDGSTYIDGSDTYQIAGQTLLELVEAVYDVRSEYHVPVINNYHDTNFNKFTRDIYFQDGVHLNEAGRKALGDRVAHQLLSII